MNRSDQEVIPIFLRELRLTSMLGLWKEFADRATLDGWPPTRYLSALCEQEMLDRQSRRLARHMSEAKLPKGKSLDFFDFNACPSLNKGQIVSLASGDAWIENRMNLLIFGPSGVGKTHLAAAIGEALIKNRFRVFFTRTTDLVQKLQAAKVRLELPAALEKLDKYDCLILDDFGYVKKDQQETNVLFELICERYERKSLIITCNQAFTEWDTIFTDKAMAVAAVDRVIHHSTILKITGESYRRQKARARSEEEMAKKMSEEKSE